MQENKISLSELLNDLNNIEDDEEFMLAEYSAAQTYCEEHNFELSNNDLEELEARGLMESFVCWKEQNNEPLE